MHTSLVTNYMIDSDRSQEKNQIDILNRFHIHDWTINNLWIREILIWKGNIGGKAFLR